MQHINIDTADSWDTDWRSAKPVDCTKIVTNSIQMVQKPKERQTIRCSAGNNIGFDAKYSFEKNKLHWYPTEELFNE